MTHIREMASMAIMFFLRMTYLFCVILPVTRIGGVRQETNREGDNFSARKRIVVKLNEIMFRLGRSTRECLGAVPVRSCIFFKKNYCGSVPVQRTT